MPYRKLDISVFFVYNYVAKFEKGENGYEKSYLQEGI